MEFLFIFIDDRLESNFERELFGVRFCDDNPVFLSGFPGRRRRRRRCCCCWIFSMFLMSM